MQNLQKWQLLKKKKNRKEKNTKNKQNYFPPLEALWVDLRVVSSAQVTAKHAMKK